MKTFNKKLNVFKLKKQNYLKSPKIYTKQDTHIILCKSEKHIFHLFQKGRN
jgi:hypothetical protein